MMFKFGMVVFIGGWTLAKHVAVGFLAIAAACCLACSSCDTAVASAPLIRSGRV